MHRTTLAVLLVALTVPSGLASAAETNSNRITVIVRGKGPDVVLIPGLACSNAVWDAAAQRLEGRYRLHLIQIAGFAGLPSQANAQSEIIQPVVDAIHAYIKINRLKSPKVVGHSLGGLIGVMLAIQHPEDVNGLMLVDALPFYSVLFGAGDAAAAAPQAAVIRDRMLSQTQEAYAQSEQQFIRALVKSPEGRKQVIDWAVASDKSVVARVLYEDLTTDLRPKLQEIKATVMVLYPWDASTGISQVACDGLYQKSYAALPNKTFVRIDESYHFIMLDQPDKFAAQVESFLK